MKTLINNKNDIKIIIGTFLLFSCQVEASDFGTTGLIDTPTAKMQPDATLSTTIMVDEIIESYMVTYQALDWLEATYRYTGFKNTGGWDRNLEIKANILSESTYIPELSIGARDVLGTGVFGAEYLVASKQYKNFEFNFGLGWGVLSGDSNTKNILFEIFPSLEQRVSTNAAPGEGGQLQSDIFFSGKNIGFFGGIKYTFDGIPLSLVVEYDPNVFLSGASDFDTTQTDQHINLGLTYEFADDTFLSVNYKHQEMFGLSLTSRINTASRPAKYKTPKFVSALDLPQSKLPAGIDGNSWYDLLLYDVERANLFLLGAKLFVSEKRAELEIANSMYPYWPDAIDKAHQLASLHLPRNIKIVDYIVNMDGHRVQTIRLPRDPWRSTDSISVAQNATILPSRSIIKPNFKTGFVKDEITVNANLDNRIMLFDPDQPLSIQFFVNLDTKIPLPSEWNLLASYRFDIYNNFGNLNRFSDSALPPVRTESLKYLQDGENGLENLYLDKRGTFANVPRLHYRMFGGVLETMYSGVGGELLYQPSQSRLAFGLSANAVKKRDYDGSLRHLDYETVTAFASLYWASPFQNYDFAIHAGRYLAKDVGATLEFRRTFDNGWQIGAWATRTNVSSEDFGEGSFDKGFFLRVPFGSLFGSSSRSVFQTKVRPVQRDGGARLPNHSANLWFDMRDARYDVFSNAGKYR